MAGLELQQPDCSSQIVRRWSMRQAARQIAAGAYEATPEWRHRPGNCRRRAASSEHTSAKQQWMASDEEGG
jgi:predicted nuclease of restriction endonuclease-like (RecB) superfamily